MPGFDAAELVRCAEDRLDAALHADLEALAVHDGRIAAMADARRPPGTAAEEAAVRQVIALLRLGDLALADLRDDLRRRMDRTGERRRAGQAYAASARSGL
jgi:hypothetical protein